MPKKTVPIVCHQGIEHKSFLAFYLYYKDQTKLSKTTVFNRIKDGYTPYDALFAPKNFFQGQSMMDHKGETFPNKKALAKHYARKLGISAAEVTRRIDLYGVSEETLEVKNLRNKPTKDHEGREFRSVRAMAVHWSDKLGVPRHQIEYHLMKGKTMAEFVERLDKKNANHEDELGITHPNRDVLFEVVSKRTDLSVNYLRTEVYRGRTIKEIVENYPYVYDHEGRRFINPNVMMNYWAKKRGVNKSLLYERWKEEDIENPNVEAVLSYTTEEYRAYRKERKKKKQQANKQTTNHK